MASERQIAANRRNAQKSTGPRTCAGKARSRRNALKDGLTATSLLIDVFTDEEGAYIDTLAGPQAGDAAWDQARSVALTGHRLRRCQEVQAEILEAVLAEAAPAGTTGPEGDRTRGLSGAWSEPAGRERLLRRYARVEGYARRARRERGRALLSLARERLREGTLTQIVRLDKGREEGGSGACEALREPSGVSTLTEQTQSDCDEAAEPASTSGCGCSLTNRTQTETGTTKEGFLMDPALTEAALDRAERISQKRSQSGEETNQALCGESARQAAPEAAATSLQEILLEVLERPRPGTQNLDKRSQSTSATGAVPGPPAPSNTRRKLLEESSHGKRDGVLEGESGSWIGPLPGESPRRPGRFGAGTLSDPYIRPVRPRGPPHFE